MTVMRTLDNDTIKAGALRDFGFSACGCVRPDAVDAAVADAYRRWIAEGRHADMSYLANNVDMRLDPRLLMPEARTMICLAQSYAPDPEYPLSADGYAFSAYALGKDYHDVVRQRLHQLASHLGLETYRVFCDTAPILERYWAARAGLGWIGRNHQLIIPGQGSMFFLGEILTDAECDRYDSPAEFRCGSCRKCLDACPTRVSEELRVKSEEFVSKDPVSEEWVGEAFSTFGGSNSSLLTLNSSLTPLHSSFNSSRCLSYQTIENRGDIPMELHGAMGRCIYGCDRCQTVCPHNRAATPTQVEEFRPSEALRSMTRDDWDTLTVEQYCALFKGSAVKRAKYEGLVRNIKAVREALEDEARSDGGIEDNHQVC